jgi:hypothetical protein
MTMYTVGLVLDVLNNSGFSAGELYALDSFRIALSVQFLVLAVGVTAVIISRREVRREMAADGIVVPPLRVALADRRRRREQYRAETRNRGNTDGGPQG